MTSKHVLNDISQRIEETSDVTAANLSDELLASDKPLLLRGLASDWPAVKHGLESADKIIEYLRDFDSGNAVTALYAPPEAGGRIFYNQDLTAFNFEYRLRATMAGAFRAAPALLQSMYAPEFTAYSAGSRLEVAPGD